MTLDEAINKEEALAYSFGERYKRLGEPVGDLPELEAEHEQYAEWLRELQQRRKYENGCQYCKYKVRSDEDEPCVICSHNYTNKFRDDGTREVNADE